LNDGGAIVQRFFTSASLLVLVSVGAASELGRQTPTQAPDVVAQAVDAADRDRPEVAVTMLQRAIAKDPNDVRAHAEYVRIKTFYLARYDAVRGEYDRLMAREPDNPVYPMALALGTPGAVPARKRAEWYQQVSGQTPESVWGHYAKAQLILSSDLQGAAKALRAAIDKDPATPEPYESLIGLLERSLKDVEGALAVGERMAAQPGLASRALPTLWRLRFARAGGSPSAKEELRSALEQASRTTDISTLNGIRRTYAQTLNDTDSANRIADRIRQIDPSWYPERGLVTMFAPSRAAPVSNDARRHPFHSRT
jgi:tetratricopeptide (TPR) repeat protein